MSRRTMSVAQHAAAFLVSVIVSGRGLHFYHNYDRWPSVPARAPLTSPPRWRGCGAQRGWRAMNVLMTQSA